MSSSSCFECFKVLIPRWLNGKDSLAKKIFGIDKLIVENEYILPHHTIARVIFGDFTNTIIVK